MIYFWQTIQVTVTEATCRNIRCEKCGQEYSFVDEKTATCAGDSTYALDNAGATRVARGDAEKKVRRLLESEIGAVPCPHCGWYQQSMMRAIRRSRYRWMLTTAWNLFRFSPFIGLAAMAVVAMAEWVVDARRSMAGAAFVVGMMGSLVLSPMLPVLRGLLCALYNPNRAISEDDRKALGQRLVLTSEQSQAITTANSVSTGDHTSQLPTTP